MLIIDRVSKKFNVNGKEKIAVDNVSVKIKKGETVCIVGPNGAGKTTTVKICSGFVLPDSGNVYYDSISLLNRKKYLEKISVLFEGIRSINWVLTPLENMEYLSGLRGIKKNKKDIEKYIEMFELGDYKNQQCNSLSRGNQQKVAIACCLCLETDVVFMDEPTLGLDMEISHKIIKILKTYAQTNKKIFVITTHDSDFIEEIADKVLIIEKGKIMFEGSCEKFKTVQNTNTFKEAYLKYRGVL